MIRTEEGGWTIWRWEPDDAAPVGEEDLPPPPPVAKPTGGLAFLQLARQGMAESKARRRKA